MPAFDIDIEDRRGQPPPSPPVGLGASPLVIAQQCALVSQLALAQQVANIDLAAKGLNAGQQAADRLRLAILARAVTGLRASPLQARSAVMALTGNQGAQGLLDLEAATRPRRPAP